LDPASSHGVLRALMSGIMAAHLCASVISGSVPEDEGAEYYRAYARAAIAALLAKEGGTPIDRERIVVQEHSDPALARRTLDPPGE